MLPHQVARNSHFRLCHLCCPFGLVLRFHPGFERYVLKLISKVSYLKSHHYPMLIFYCQRRYMLVLKTVVSMQMPLISINDQYVGRGSQHNSQDYN